MMFAKYFEYYTIILRGPFFRGHAAYDTTFPLVQSHSWLGIRKSIRPVKNSETRSTATVHTSAKACLTSVTIPIWIHDPDIHDPDRHQNLIICSLAHCQPSLKISHKSVQKFLRKVADRQTNRETDTHDCISCLAEVMRCWRGYLSTATTSPLASLKPSLVYPLWCRLTRVVLEKRALNCLSMHDITIRVATK